MKTIYNEGRVVGLSAYELYVRTMLSRNPKASILTENQWLAASLSTNNSMIIKITAGTKKGYHDYTLPSKSDLCGCTFIIGTLFEGSTTVNGVWATRVDDYGRLISNTGDRHPVTPGKSANVPVQVNYNVMSQDYIDQCNEFMKLSSGIMLQPGDWVTNVYQEELLNEEDVNITTEDDEDLLADLSDSASNMTLSANLSERGFVRILFNQAITKDFYIFLHGFSYKNVLGGMSGFEDLSNTTNPENGDFLGPQSFPWATPIVFVYNNDMMNLITDNINSAINTLDSRINALLSSIDALETAVTTTLPNSISSLAQSVASDKAELNQRIDDVRDTVGDLAGLTTVVKSNCVNAINEVNGKIDDLVDDLQD